MCDVFNIIVKYFFGLRCKDKIKLGGICVSWKYVFFIGLDVVF